MNELNQSLKHGAFLTSEYNGKVNAMTIGWGMEGRSWEKPVFVAMVRPSRYTYEILTQSNTFTISIPKAGTMKDELRYFGSASGRNENKFMKSDLDLINARNISGKVVAGCESYYECCVVYMQQMQEDGFLCGSNLKNRYYPEGDFHWIIFGEILASYQNEL
jgi:flavin reductase (DIM6/NTAB) family NADH-FMN oxidoreductase RutF